MKITTNVSLKVILKGKKVLRAELTKENVHEDHSLKALVKDYLEGKGDIYLRGYELSAENLPPKVWRVLKFLKENVPPGESVTYGELGKALGFHPRFVGYCMATNPFPLLIPCHRVVSKAGLGGFSYGLDIKEELLSFERLKFKRSHELIYEKF